MYGCVWLCVALYDRVHRAFPPLQSVRETAIQCLTASADFAEPLVHPMRSKVQPRSETSDEHSKQVGSCAALEMVLRR